MWGRKKREREAEEAGRRADESFSKQFRQNNPPPDISRGEIPTMVHLDSGQVASGFVKDGCYYVPSSFGPQYAGKTPERIQQEAEEKQRMIAEYEAKHGPGSWYYDDGNG